MNTAEMIAEKVGVCRQTVSAVLNGNMRKASEATRRAILDAAEEFGYVPDLNAKAMSGRSVKTIGLIMPAMENALTPFLLSAINQEILARGYQCYSIIPRTPDDEKRALKEFVSRKFDGLIVGRLSDTLNISYIRQLPAVFCNVIPEIAEEVRGDLDFGMMLALEHLYLDHRHRKIVFFSNSIDGNQAKYDAYQKFTKRHRLTAYPPVETLNQPDFQDNLLRLVREGATAFVCTSDILAANLVNFFSRNGISVPGDVAVTGYDGLLLTSSGAIQLSAVVHPVWQIARNLVNLIFDRIARGVKGDAESRGNVRWCRPVFYKGQTCGCGGYHEQSFHSNVILDCLQEDPAYDSFFIRELRDKKLAKGYIR